MLNEPRPPVVAVLQLVAAYLRVEHVCPVSLAVSPVGKFNQNLQTWIKLKLNLQTSKQV